MRKRLYERKAWGLKQEHKKSVQGQSPYTCVFRRFYLLKEWCNDHGHNRYQFDQDI